jgi:alpha-N-arabinofuranosidase
MGAAVSNDFGYDELYKLSTNLGFQIILTVNFGDAVLDKKTLSKAALHAASLVAYCNAKVGATLPVGMENWPAVRAKNGFKKPFGIKYFQIGNETWFLTGKMTQKEHVKYVKAYVKKMKEVDPSIKIIVDAISQEHVKKLKAALGKKIDYIVQHNYLPWIITDKNVEKNGKLLTVNKLTEKDVWYAWVGIPNTFNSSGESIIDGVAIDVGEKYNYKVAITEWNFAGWWEKPENSPLDSYVARGLGAAGFLHAFMRSGDIIKIACQSMTVGKAWGLTAIHVSQEQAFDPFFLPTGQLLAMYSKYHGNNFLGVKGEKIPTYNQPIRMNILKPNKKIALVDALATGNESNIFFHVINRDFSKDIPINIDVSAFNNVSSNGIHRILQGDLYKTLESNSPTGYFTNEKFKFNGKNVSLILPKRSISIIQFNK